MKPKRLQQVKKKTAKFPLFKDPQSGELIAVRHKIGESADDAWKRVTSKHSKPEGRE